MSIDANEARRIVGQWLRLRSEHAADSVGLAEHLVEKHKQSAVFMQLAIDAEHSSLLTRLLNGEEPMSFEEWQEWKVGRG